MSVESKLSRLSLDLENTQVKPPNTSGTSLLPTQPEATPDSWEDDAGNTSDSAVEAPGPSLKQVTSIDGPAPPPPTPISPRDGESLLSRKWDSTLRADERKPATRYTSSDASSTERRPEKTTATANRMIAGALGIRAPKKTEEQKQYDKATQEAELKRRAREKEAREQERLDNEQAKNAVWDS